MSYQLSETEQREIGLALLERYSSLAQLRDEINVLFVGDQPPPTTFELEEHLARIESGYRSVLEQPQVQKWLLDTYAHIFGQVEFISEADMVEIITALHLAPILLSLDTLDSR